tara:strand:- start:249 stop:1313 length:1065 start_codon:yes stop_codon:yes gene_type:complete
MAWTNPTGVANGVATDTNAVARSGRVGQSGDPREIFLKQFSGEVLTSFEEKNIAMPLHRVRTISNGKSAQFPSIGTIGADYHQAGQTILGDTVDHNEVTVTVDDLLVSSAFVPSIDEAMRHYEVRSTYSAEMGNALANAADKNIFSTIYKASQTTSGGDLAGYWTGTNGTVTAAGDTGQNFVDAVIASLQKFDEANVTGEKYVVVTPETYYSLFGATGASSGFMVNTAMNQDVGGNGSVALGNAPSIMGCKILMSNHLPTAAQSTPTQIGENSGSTFGTEDDDGNSTQVNATDYSQNNANLKGLIFTKDAAATVKLLDLGVESEYQIERQGTLMVAKYAMGHNVLRGKSAIAIV